LSASRAGPADASAFGCKSAERAPSGEVREYSCGYFDFCGQEVHRTIVNDQIDLLNIHLPRQPVHSGLASGS
jgi:hypothetical protein